MFKHESQDPFATMTMGVGTKLRPWWLDDEDVLMHDENGRLVVKKIKELTEEEYKKCKKEGRI